ncbi:MAG: hypothetical protein CM1200mP2_19380 [Planctomycetaceae bacterium]|nr:MAG: hypothetical protein CM1200mP2_19380 [Planctomycetaceae bacterium]
MRLFGKRRQKVDHRFKGLDFRLTGVGESGHVVNDLIG